MINNIFEGKTEQNIFINKDNIIKKVYKDIVFNNSKLVQNNEKDKIIELVKSILVQNYNIIDKNSIEEYTEKILNKMFGYDIIQRHIDDIATTDIRIVAYDRIYTKKCGKWGKVKDKFKSNEEFLEFITCTVIKNGGKINYDSPIATVVDRKYNLRIEAGISPVNSISASLVIRIHRNTKNITLNALNKKYHMFDKNTLDYLINIIKSNKNIIISGKGGSGKTTLLRAMINEIDENVAICTNEETTELFIKNKNIIQREIISNRKTNNITLETLTKQSLILSNDQIIIGELKSSEAIIFFDAISTGHVGYATVHSNSVYNTLNRLVMLAKRSESAYSIDIYFLKLLLASSIDVIIHIENFKISNILSIEYNHMKDTYKYTDIYIRGNENVDI